MRCICFFIAWTLWTPAAQAQSQVDSFTIFQDVKITSDVPALLKSGPTILILYALPNGNTTTQTMGKKVDTTDDWHYDIQHVKAQTAFVREKLPKKNIITVYLENTYKSWPLWKQKHPDYQQIIPHIVDTILNLFPSARHKRLYLNGHSGGGSFIFGYLQSIPEIPSIVDRICFLDSDYGYDSTFYPKFKNWLQRNKKSILTVFAYNDSVALYNGKPIVSAKGGTWYRSHLLLEHLQQDFSFINTRKDSLVVYESTHKQIAFFFKENPERKIFHTWQVELNGFIHSVLYGTQKENEEYEYFGPRAYTRFIK
jgi:hypothetical protein